jgi:hypothetical protein
MSRKCSKIEGRHIRFKFKLNIFAQINSLLIEKWQFDNN